jgi:hypothetical protein
VVGGTGVQGGPGVSAAGGQAGPSSLQPPVRGTKKRPKVPALLVPIGAGIGVVALVAVALTLLTRGDGSAGPTTSPSITDITPPITGTTPSVTGTPPITATTPPVTGTTPPITGSTPNPTYTPPTNAIPAAFGVSVVPVAGWTLLARETEGKQLVNYAPNSEPRAFFWVRQKLNVSAKNYMLGIVEGETANEVAQLGNTRNLPCPRDVLEECVAISYTSTSKGVKVQGFVEAYRRKDGVTTALDFRTRDDFALTALADSNLMRKSVVDSL